VIFDLATIFITGVILLAAIYTVFKYLGKFPDRTIDDVGPYLRPINMEEFEAILNPAEEVNSRWRLSSREFQQLQQKRIHLLYEFLVCMSHNALVLIEWGNMEWMGPQSEEKRELGHELVQAATEFRLYSLLALAKLKLWIVLRPLLPVPTLTRLRKLAGIDPVRSYLRLKEAAALLGEAYGIRYQEQLSGRL
jgi:hypothetical protein